MRKLFIALKVLSVTSEMWLDFSPGQNSETNLRRFKSRGLMEFPRQVAALLWFWWANFKFIPCKLHPAKVLVFASTPNQLSVVSPILERRGTDTTFVTTLKRSTSGSSVPNWHSVGLEPSLMLQVVLLTLIRLPILLRNLFKRNPALINRRIKSFCTCYYWLVYHQKLLYEVKPNLVVFANDHNPECRSLLELCKQAKVRTVYIPHAAVSPRFHAIDFDYSLMDGKNAVDTYQSCEGRRSRLSYFPNNRKYFITGGLRPLKITSKNQDTDQYTVGVAIKGTDDLSHIKSLLKEIKGGGDVILRWHPNISKSHSRQVAKIAEEAGVEISDPAREFSADFLRRIRYLVCGNSTLLLEAALLEVVPVFLHSMSGGVLDYYGFVRYGICEECKSDSELLDLIFTNELSEFTPSISGLNYFCGSYGTSFWGQEQTVANEILDHILDETSPISFKDVQTGYFHK